MARDLKHLEICRAGAFGHGVTRNAEGVENGEFRTMMYDTRLDRYYHRLEEGGVVIDGRNAPMDDAVKEIIRGPMLGIRLEPGHISRISDAVPVLYMAGEPVGGLDCVALNLYADRWRALGARVGKRVGDSIIWEGELFSELIVVYD